MNKTLLQLSLGSSEAFSEQKEYSIPSSCSGSTLVFPPCGLCLRSILIRCPKYLSWIIFDAEEQQLYSPKTSHLYIIFLWLIVQLNRELTSAACIWDLLLFIQSWSKSNNRWELECRQTGKSRVLLFCSLFTTADRIKAYITTNKVLICPSI